MAEDIKTIYATALRNTRALEKQGLEPMERQLAGLKSYPDYAAVLRDHMQTTQAQLSRLDTALEAIGEKPSALKEAVTSVAGTIGTLGHAIAGDETLKDLFAGYAYQYDQIAAYRSLIVIAEAAGQSAQSPQFEKAVEEETKAAERIAALIEPVTQTYLTRATAGTKADS
jgi:ferritin-like metal-binding protein YciE